MLNESTISIDLDQPLSKLATQLSTASVPSYPSYYYLQKIWEQLADQRVHASTTGDDSADDILPGDIKLSKIPTVSGSWINNHAAELPDTFFCFVTPEQMKNVDVAALTTSQVDHLFWWGARKENDELIQHLDEMTEVMASHYQESMPTSMLIHYFSAPDRLKTVNITTFGHYKELFSNDNCSLCFDARLKILESLQGENLMHALEVIDHIDNYLRRENKEFYTNIDFSSLSDTQLTEILLESRGPKEEPLLYRLDKYLTRNADPSSKHFQAVQNLIQRLDFSIFDDQKLSHFLNVKSINDFHTSKICKGKVGIRVARDFFSADQMNYFVAHLSSNDLIRTLSKTNINLIDWTQFDAAKLASILNPKLDIYIVFYLVISMTKINNT